MTNNIGELSHSLKADSTTSVEAAVRDEVNRALVPTHSAVQELKQMVAQMADKS